MRVVCASSNSAQRHSEASGLVSHARQHSQASRPTLSPELVHRQEQPLLLLFLRLALLAGEEDGAGSGCGHEDEHTPSSLVREAPGHVSRRDAAWSADATLQDTDSSVLVVCGSCLLSSHCALGWTEAATMHSMIRTFAS